MIVIPALDIIEGKVVRLQKGEYSKRVNYSNNPVEIAKAFEDGGLTHLHVVDLEGAKKGNPVNLKVIEEIANKTKLIIDYGGGIKDRESLVSVLSAGVKEVSIGSLAVKNPSLVYSFLEEFSAFIILSADEKDGKIAVSAWQEETEVKIIPFIKDYYLKGIKKVISTDISKDGMLSGPSFSLYKEIKDNIPNLKIIASGGISCKNDLLSLSSLSLYGAIVGKAFYEGKITIREMKEVEDAK